MEKVAEEKAASRWRPGDTPVPWLLPLALVLVLVFVYPILEILRLSFTDASLVRPEYAYTLESYITLLRSPDFLSTLRITFIFVFASVVFQVLLGFIIALVVDQGVRRGLRGTIVTRTAVLSAWAIPGVIIGIIWSILYEESAAGILNHLANLVGFGSIPFLSEPNTALASVTVANIWRGTAFSMILIYAGLQTLPEDVLEAAKIDGANAWQRLTRVMIPLLAPVLFITLIIVTIETFNTFDMVMALTGGGPGRGTEVIALSIYYQIFQQLNLGRGAAAAVMLLAVNMIITFVYLRYIERRQGIE
ncbi:sugar ABC transporter permease [Rubrobacter taiwanensis]|uniref:Sugar ABC transporter permease n=1 Tax=Rubrobacter taiwanensis TaxID=185139 RepID=A0A4R1BI49_9ACTN|nr:sugar ABC transporter permease [Rubrobacter taiwanensis]TCJ16939.1 sugar ABC transporter permease [Rubrobacter taiwanensis]